nr:isopeptide-forming domain-containing fimbrial protein [Bacillus subtilis]
MKYDGFSTDTANQLFYLNGSAQVPNGTDFIRLTPASETQAGAAINKNEICPKDNYSFSTAFSFKMSNPGPKGPSDGLTFTIQGDTTSSLTNGGSLAFYGIKPSFTIKYDTFLNTGYGDPSANYIGLAENGDPVNKAGWYTDLDQYNTANGTNYVLSNGTQYYTWIDYDGLTKNVQVRLGTSPDRASSKQILDVNGIDLGTVFNGKPFYAGFTGSTGSPNYETHDIYNWYFVNHYNPIETLNQQNDYKQAPSTVKVTTDQSNQQGGYNVTVTLLDPLGNPVQGAPLDSFTASSGELTGPNGEAVTSLVSDADGKIHAILKNADHSKDITISASNGCANDSGTIPAGNKPPTAPDDSKTTTVNTPVSGEVSGSDPDGDSLTYKEGKQPSHGTIKVNDDGTWTYTPDKGYSGDDSFTIIVDDGYGGTTETTITIHVNYNPPSLESKKTADLKEKAAGNKDADHPEVGDTLLYTIQTRNTVENSLVKNLVISDSLPEGLEYVPGTLKVDGTGVSDTKDDDQGHYVDGKATGEFGNVSDTKWHAVTFEAKVQPGQSGKDIVNTASVTGDNIVTPDKPKQEVKVYPRNPELESKKTSSIQEKGEGNTDADHPEVGDTLLYKIQTRNISEDSLVKNLVISDAIPEGLEYVPETLKVDGTAVSDSEGDDQGHYADGKIIGDFGEVTDVEWHNVTFEVKVKTGQAGKDIVNTANISGDNVDIPNKPSNEVKVYPRDPVLESEKTAKNFDSAKEKYEVGDTVVYTIKARNKITESTLENLVISDELPAGLSYVDGSLKASNGGEATVKDGKVTANFGDVTDTEWRTVTFQAEIESGYAEKTIKNVATVDGGNIDLPDKPETSIKIDPKDPKLESKKTASIKEKADGNKDADHPEVGDTLLYTIETRNTIEDSLVKNLVISDSLPEGLEYVSGTLKVDGTEVSDDQDDDHGYYADGKVSGEFGNVTDTKWHSVTFEVKVRSGQAGKDIVNTANISSDNITTPDKPSHEVKVYPRIPVLESEKTAKNLDTDKKKYEVGDTVAYTIKTRNTVSDGKVENLVISDELPAGLKYVEGSLKTSNGGEATIKDGKITANFGDVTDTEWHTVTFQAKIESGYAEKTIKNVATVDGDNIDTPDKPGTDIKVDPKDPKLESKKTASIKEKAEGNKDADHPEVGDTLLYTIQTRNTVKDSLVKNLVISDSLPEGLEYVSGTLKVDGTAVSDDQDDDDGKVSGEFGNVTDTKWHSVTFEAKVKSGQAGKDIVNTANISGDNITTPDKPSHEVKVYPRIPVLESEKTAKNLDTDKKKYEVGDTVVYTIKTRNTVSDGKVENLVISDELPAGLKYVEGSLKTSNGGEATIKEGKVTANFGDVTDTEWRTVTFQAKIESGYEGKTIKNVATVEGSSIDKPDKPEADITVQQKDPVSDKPEVPGKPSKPNNPTNTSNPEKPNQTEPATKDQGSDTGNELPNTATNTYNLILVGLVLLVAGTALWYFRRKRNV